jgi:hypothetical protein
MIWPFTTITKLRDDLKQTQLKLTVIKDDFALERRASLEGEAHIRSLLGEIEDLRRRHQQERDTTRQLLEALKIELIVTKKALAAKANKKAKNV